MAVSLSVITPPASEPVTLSEAKAHLRVEVSTDDALITALIAAAREHAEAVTARAFLPQTLEARWDEWPTTLALPRAPVASVSSVKYLDADGVEQTLSGQDYRVDLASIPPRITPTYGTLWPEAQAVTGAVAVRFVAGYANAGAVPAAIKQAMLLLVAHLYENRAAAVERALTTAPLAYDALLAPYRIYWL
jgi:uncharacterized phiE125 gp8 family phage protein